MKRLYLVPTLVFALTTCGREDAPAPGSGGADTAAAPSTPSASAPAAPTGPMTMPDWFQVDNDARTVHMTVTAGSTSVNNYWNFNGGINGQLAINVPEGYTVTIDFINSDPNMAHSLGISEETSSFAIPPATTPVFEGAISQNPGSMIDGTMPGESETVEFVAETVGNYSMVCYIPGHSAVGMWLYFNVTDGEAGVQGSV
jgi:hypothetical protein